jgi:hypothetical protein
MRQTFIRTELIIFPLGGLARTGGRHNKGLTAIMTLTACLFFSPLIPIMWPSVDPRLIFYLCRGNGINGVNLAAIKELISAAATVMRVPAHSRLYDPGIACLFSFARGLEKYFARQSGSYFRCQK